MYEAMRQRAPNSTKLTGAMSAVMLTLAAGYALSNGFGRNIAKLIEPATVVSIVEDTHDTPPPPPTSDLNTKVAIGEAPVPQLPVFVFTPPPDDGGGIIARPGPQTKEAGPAPPPPPAPAPVRKMPKLMPGPKPDYPVREIRAQSQGVTELSVCVAANGRVSSASVASSSGHPGLDEAALKWVRTSRFSPGTVDGKAQDVCGHTVTYEWSLKDAGQ